MQKTKMTFLGIAAMAVSFSNAATAEDHVIKAAVTKFDPVVVFAKPGDKIIWENMSGHDTASLEGMIPEGAESWHSQLGEQFAITVDKEGAYVYKCTPHVALGMLGAIVVGDSAPANMEAIEAAVETTKEPKGMVKRVVRELNKALDDKGK